MSAGSAFSFPCTGHPQRRATAHRLPLWVAEAESSLAAALDVQELFV